MSRPIACEETKTTTRSRPTMESIRCSTDSSKMLYASLQGGTKVSRTEVLVLSCYAKTLDVDNNTCASKQ